MNAPGNPSQRNADETRACPATSHGPARSHVTDSTADRGRGAPIGACVISQQLQDRRGRTVSLREIGADWRAVADVAPHPAQRAFVFPLAARYMLLAVMEGEWHSLGIYADTDVVGHVMWAFDVDDGAHWIGGLIIHGGEQRVGVGAAAMRTLTAWLHAQPNSQSVRLSYHPADTAAHELYASLGFVPTGGWTATRWWSNIADTTSRTQSADHRRSRRALQPRSRPHERPDRAPRIPERERRKADSFDTVIMGRGTYQVGSTRDSRVPTRTSISSWCPALWARAAIERSRSSTRTPWVTCDP